MSVKEFYFTLLHVYILFYYVIYSSALNCDSRLCVVMHTYAPFRQSGSHPEPCFDQSGSHPEPCVDVMCLYNYDIGFTSGYFT